jgi:hypothetical protein
MRLISATKTPEISGNSAKIKTARSLGVRGRETGRLWVQEASVRLSEAGDKYCDSMRRK